MITPLERVAVKARNEPNLRFTSLAHHVSRDLVWKCLTHVPNSSSPGVDGLDARSVKESFENWVDDAISAIHRQGYHPPPVRRVYIPKPGKAAKRPIGVSCIADRALQRSVSTVLSEIYEQDFLKCSFGGRPDRNCPEFTGLTDVLRCG